MIETHPVDTMRRGVYYVAMTNTKPAHQGGNVKRSPVWETDYRADRRRHHHRCVACNRIVATGERVLMGRPYAVLADRPSPTKVVHVACADRLMTSDGPAYGAWLALVCMAPAPAVQDLPLHERIRLRQRAEAAEEATW